MRLVLCWVVVALGSACGPPRAPGLETPAGGAAGASGAAAGAAGAGAVSAGSDTGGAAAGQGGEGATAGGGAAGGEGGSPAGGAGGATPACGNDLVEAGEDCEDGQLEGASCESLGYASGVLSCWDCGFDSSGCAFDEECTDGADNDGDGDIDCGDADCAAACADPCAQPRTVADPGLTTGSTTDQANRVDASCSGGVGLSGAEAVFRFVPDLDGLVEARLTSSAAELTVSIRQGCEPSASELACALGATASALVTAGTELFIVVDGATATEAGPFILEVGTRELACGNALLDPGEECEDGGTELGDGCDAACAVESSEGAANDVASAADALVIPYFGRISPANDVDWVAVEVPADGGAIYAATRGFLDGDCASGALDTYLELYAPDGIQRLTSNDDWGSSCAVLEATGLAAGTYLLRVFGVTENTPEFAYVLDVAVP